MIDLSAGLEAIFPMLLTIFSRYSKALFPIKVAPTHGLFGHIKHCIYRIEKGDLKGEIRDYFGLLYL